MAIDPVVKYSRTIAKRLVDLSNRMCTHGFLIPDFEGIVVCNPTSKDAKAEFSDNITKYCVGELGLHFVEFKNKDYYRSLISWVTGNNSKAAIIHLDLAKISSVINKYLPDQIKLATVNGTRVVKNWAALSGKPGDVVLSNDVENYQILVNLRLMFDDARRILVKMNEVSRLDITIGDTYTVSNRTYFVKIDPAELKPIDTNPFTHHLPLTLVATDGVTLPSITGNFRKTGQIVKSVTHIFPHDACSLRILTEYEDQDFKVISFPANLYLTPLTK